MSANDRHARDSPIKTPRQLVTVVVLAFVVPVIVIVLLTQLVTGGRHFDRDSPAMSPEEVAKRIKPVAEINIGEAGPEGRTLKTGEEIYKSVCIACHATGVANAPKFGDKAAWAPRLHHGANELYQTALKGKGAMPPKGGNLTLSETEVKAAVDYMVGAVK